jgi:hypothetical protein
MANELEITEELVTAYFKITLTLIFTLQPVILTGASGVI